MASHRSEDPRPRAVAVTGSTGLVGSALLPVLRAAGHRVVRLVRREARSGDERAWDPGAPADDLLDGIDAVVHLAGASIAGRFTAVHKAAIRDSRVRPTELLARATAAAQPGLTPFISASAIGYYGPDRTGELLTEASPAGDGFLAETVAAWEEATRPAAAAGIRVVNVRTGVAQAVEGGPLRIYLPLFRLGLGGRFGHGRQHLSWIDLDDLVAVYRLALEDERLEGPVNAVAPNPVPNAAYTQTLADVLRRRAPFVVPRFATRLALGAEGSRELVEADQRVAPAVLTSVGFRFRFPDLRSSLEHRLVRGA